MALWIISGAFAALASPFVLIALRVFARDRAILRWPRARGVVISSGVTSSSYQRRDEQTGEYATAIGYTPVVQYRYTVGDRVFHGDKIDREQASTDRRPAEECAHRYPPEKQVEVLYDPNDPTTAYLEIKRSTGATVLMAMGCVFLFVAALLATLAIVL